MMIIGKYSWILCNWGVCRIINVIGMYTKLSRFSLVDINNIYSEKPTVVKQMALDLQVERNIS